MLLRISISSTTYITLKEKKLNVDQAAEMALLKEETDATVASLREELIDAASQYT